MKSNRILGIKNRYFILVFIVLGIVFHGVLGIKALSPHVQLPAEPLFTIVPGFDFTNTLLATLLADILLLLVAVSVRRATSGNSMVPSGIAGAIEALLEALYNLTESTAGKYARKIFPWFATITLLVLFVNWMELIPGVDSIGLFQPHHVHSEEVAEAPAEGEHAEEEAHEDGAHSEDHAAFDALCTTQQWLFFTSVSGDPECASAVVPFVRVASTDLNFTVALAVTSVFMTQVIGVQALGGSYFKKFFNVSGIFSKPIFGVIDFAVGLLELISEISKMISFSFRLFGNIFAGSVLLFVIGSLVPIFAQSIFLMLEFFVGLIQAIVFGMLTMVFMSQATQGHHGDEEHH
ncbi:MAG: F0F1 ATP synthase subunit A [Anaerolineales bacterium]|nr:F0F1 ATP synthase subunit A [Anaerolineales bacterium]